VVADYLGVVAFGHTGPLALGQNGIRRLPEGVGQPTPDTSPEAVVTLVKDTVLTHTRGRLADDTSSWRCGGWGRVRARERWCSRAAPARGRGD
jgi:hypothetical protein